MINIDGSKTTDANSGSTKLEGGTISLGVLNLGYGNDGTLSIGAGIFGAEVHVVRGFGLSTLNQVGLGASYNDSKGAITGGDLSVRPGLGTVIVAVVTLFEPETFITAAATAIK